MLGGCLEVDFLLRWCGAPLIIVLRINLNVIEWSKLFCFGRVPEVFDVGDHQGQGDHHIGLNVAWLIFSDKL